MLPTGYQRPALPGFPSEHAASVDFGRRSEDGAVHKQALRFVETPSGSQVREYPPAREPPPKEGNRGCSTVLDVRGHCSAREACDHENRGMRLSYERAFAVAEVLVANGLNWSQLRLVASADSDRVSATPTTRLATRATSASRSSPATRRSGPTAGGARGAVAANPCRRYKTR